MTPQIIILWTLTRLVNGHPVYGPAEVPLSGIRSIAECGQVLPEHVREMRADGWKVIGPGCFAVGEIGP
jgi:hypothetical protein